MLLLDGLKAMVLGMIMVYIFLVVMILLTNLLSKILAPYAHLLEPPAQPAKKQKAKTDAPGKTLSAQDKILAKAAVEAVKMARGA